MFFELKKKQMMNGEGLKIIKCQWRLYLNPYWINSLKNITKK